MVDKKFCSTCGNEYIAGNSYCSRCGMSVAPDMNYTFSRNHQNHCTVCGSKNGPRDTYCATCGTECSEYSVAYGAQPFRAAFDDIRSAESVSDMASKAASTLNLSANLAQIKDRSVFMPAIVFAGVAVGVGIVLSFLLDLMVDGMMRDWLVEMFGTWTVDEILGDASFRFGAITMWLMTCLGGLSGSLRGEMYYGWGDSESLRANASLSLGVIWFVVIPLIALLVARQVRKAFINSQHESKEIRVMDGILGAAMFAVINIILGLFPSALGSTVSRYFDYTGDFFGFNLSLGPQIMNLLLFSFIIAFLFAMPGPRAMLETLTRRNKIVGTSCGAAVRFVRLMLLSGLIAAVVLVLYFVIWTTGELGAPGPNESGIFATAIIAVIPNLAIWAMSLLTGGSFQLSASRGFDLFGFGSFSANAFGAQIGDGRFTERATWFGVLLILAGLWVAVAAIYKFLRNEESFMVSGLATVGISTVVIWVVSSCATIALNASFSAAGDRASISASLGTASFGNFMLCAVVMAAAVAVVYGARKSPAFDRVLSKLASPAIACAVTAVATLVACLTAGWTY